MIVFSIPNFDESNFTGLLSVEVVPPLRFGVVDRDGLALHLEPFLEDARGVYLGRLDAAVIHHCQRPVLHGPVDWAPNASIYQWISLYFHLDRVVELT